MLIGKMKSQLDDMKEKAESIKTSKEKESTIFMIIIMLVIVLIMYF